MKTYTTTARRYDEMLEVLPPAAMSTGVNGIHGFLVGEATDHDKESGLPRYAAFFACDDQYVETEPLTVIEFARAVNLTEQELRDNEETSEEVRQELELHEEHGNGPVDTYLELDIGKLSDFEEAYKGEYASDEHFAREMAEGLGDIPRDDIRWPYTCIDWKQAAHELMQDYNEQDGYYFRII